MCHSLDTSRRQSCRGRLRRPRHPLAALAGAETSTRLRNQSNPSTYQGSRKKFAKQRFFGKRSRNRTKRAGCLGKLPEKRGLRRRQGAGGQGAPLTRLRCPVVPAARKLVFIPLLLLLVFGVPVPFHKRIVSVNFLNTYLPITSPTLKHPNTQHIRTLCSWQPSFVQ